MEENFIVCNTLDKQYKSMEMLTLATVFKKLVMIMISRLLKIKLISVKVKHQKAKDVKEKL